MDKIIYICIFILASCIPASESDRSELVAFTTKQEHFNHLINDKPLPDDPNLNSDKTILNRDYPIEVALYNDGKWYYDLPNLGSGIGTWKFQDGQIKLHAKYKLLFDMHIDIYASKYEAQEISMKFFDRNGFRNLLLEKTNQQ